jgi:CRP-like cAMP-binding protein
MLVQIVTTTDKCNFANQFFQKIMFDIFRKYLEDKITLTNQDLELIESVSVIKKIRKHQYLLQEGETMKHYNFVCNGFLKMYSIDANGQEHIMQFVPENYWTGDRESIESGVPAKYNIDAVEDSVVLLIKKNDFDMLLKSIPALNDFVNDLIKRNLLVLQERIQGNITYTAEEKYSNFIKIFPSITNRVPLYMIASYLGISAETLSRIRSNSTKK